jgi:hypothetical protein
MQSCQLRLELLKPATIRLASDRKKGERKR